MLRISEIGVFLNCIQGLLHLELHLGFSILKIINAYIKCLITHLTSHHCVGVVTNIVYQIPGGNYSDHAFPGLHIPSTFSATKVS